MKTSSLKIIAGGLLFLSTLAGCGNSTAGSTDNADANNKENHANTPNSAPGTEYPGSAGTESNTITDTIKQDR
ncbi:MAG: hypothetical protein V4635_07765 [Bacteroidota bacterium]